MTKNLSTVDRIVRVVIALAVAILYFTNVITGVLAIVLGILAVVLLATAVVGFCPLYAPFNFSTLKK